VRWAAVVFAAFQVLTYYRPYPAGVLPVALASVAAIGIGNAVLAAWLRRVRGPVAARRYALVALVFDVAAVMSLVFIYTFDIDTAMFALLYVIPLAGAVRFQRTGALLAMTAAAALYGLREAYGAAVFGYDLLLTSISFRVGIGYIIAAVAGAMASSLVRERDELQAATVQLKQQAAALQRQTEVLESTNAELQAATRVKDDFLAMTNHELRTPLTTILGYTAMLTKRWDDIPEEHKQGYLQRIGEQGHRLLSLVEDLLSLSTGAPRAVQLTSVNVRDAVDEALRTLAGSMEIRVDVDTDLAVVADRRRLVQILTNYLSNARKYGAAPITVTAELSEGAVQICVADSGPGVPAEFAPWLFDKFTQASMGATRTAEGTGLGLAIVHELADTLGGRCWYEPARPSLSTWGESASGWHSLT